MALFIIRFFKVMGKQKFFKGDKKGKYKSKAKRACYNYGKYGHYIANCPYEHREEDDDKKKKRRRDTRKTNTIRRKPMVRHTLIRSGTLMMRVPTLIVIVWSL
jgi:hypothetical protein